MAFCCRDHRFANVADTSVAQTTNHTFCHITGASCTDFFGTHRNGLVLWGHGIRGAGCPSVGIAGTTARCCGTILKTNTLALALERDTYLTSVAICVGVASLMQFAVALAVFVNLAIAIVVQVVTTQFLAGENLAGAGSPLSVLTGLGSGFADADARSTGGTRVTTLGLTCCTNAAVVVDFSVTIVVDVVATDIFGLGSHFSLARTPLSALA